MCTSLQEARRAKAGTRRPEEPREKRNVRQRGRGNAHEGQKGEAHERGPARATGAFSLVLSVCSSLSRRVLSHTQTFLLASFPECDRLTMTSCGAPFTITRILPSGNLTVASLRLSSGLNGTNWRSCTDTPERTRTGGARSPDHCPVYTCVDLQKEPQRYFSTTACARCVGGCTGSLQPMCCLAEQSPRAANRPKAFLDKRGRLDSSSAKDSERRESRVQVSFIS